jgi:two-component system sensor kinase FixL
LLATVAVAVLLTGLAALLALSFARRIARPLSALADAVAIGADPPTATHVQEVNAVGAAYAESRAEAQRLRDDHAELRHVARLNEMGALAAALAHEINQPLTAASNFAEAALRLLPENPDDGAKLRAAREAMEEAAEQAVHAGAIVRRLRDFLAASAGERRSADLNDIVREAVGLALADARERRIALRLNLAPDLSPVHVDRIQVAQVIVNLVRNAVEAIGTSQRRHLAVTTRRSGPAEVEVSISDTGSGIAPEVAARLFSPFVTTKSGGMGIGLAISRDIAEEHGGSLLFAPNPGGGSVFRLTLPGAKETPHG